MAPKILVEHKIADDSDVAAREGLQQWPKMEFAQLSNLAGDLMLQAIVGGTNDGVFDNAANQMNDQGVHFLNRAVQSEGALRHTSTEERAGPRFYRSSRWWSDQESVQI